MSQKVTLTYVSATPKVSKAGKPYTSLSIKTVEHGERYINGFQNKVNKNWKEGDEVNVSITEKEYNGKMYLSFEVPDMTTDLLAEVNALRDEIKKIREVLKPIYLEWKARQPRTPSKVIGTDIDYPENEGQPNFELDESEINY